MNNLLAVMLLFLGFTYMVSLQINELDMTIKSAILIVICVYMYGKFE